MNTFRAYFAAGLIVPSLYIFVLAPMGLPGPYGINVIAMFVGMLATGLPIICSLEYANNEKLLGDMQWRPTLLRAVAFALPLAIVGCFRILHMFDQYHLGTDALMSITAVALLGLYGLTVWNGVIRGTITPIVFRTA
jgi:hypothetical protein